MAQYQTQTTSKYFLDNLPPLRISIDALMHREGTWPVIGAVATGIFRAARLRQEIDNLPNEVRQDIGLPAKPDPIRLRERLR